MNSPAIGVEHHRSHRSGWLRAAVLGANDGIVSTTSLLIGIAAAAGGRNDILIAGVAATAAGALSMAAGEYVSVYSQRDTELADLDVERAAIEQHPEAEERELAAIYEGRGLSPELAQRVAEALHAHDPVEAHARDELGITPQSAARPVQAASTSALAFAAGAALPVLAAALLPRSQFSLALASVALVALAVLGAASARAGGAPAGPATLRVLVWSSIAMFVTWLIGLAVGTVV